MLGCYPNFPQNIHKTVQLSASTSSRTLQRVLTNTFYTLNSETFNLKDVTIPSVQNCEVKFEVGIAEGNGFNYIDAEEKAGMLSAISNRPFRIMDFFFAIRYYKTVGKKTPMRFDYYMLRLTFGKKVVEMQISHEKGPMHILPDDLQEFVVNKINATSSRRILKPAS